MEPGHWTPVGSPCQGRRTGAVYAMAVSPRGQLVATAGGDTTVRLWNLATGAPVGQPVRGHTTRVDALAFSADGKHLASADRDGTVRLWAIDTENPTRQAFRADPGSVSSVAFNGSTLATAGTEDGTDGVRLWTLTGEPIGDPVGNRVDANSVAFSPDGLQLAIGGFDGLLLWGAGAPPQVLQRSGVNSLAFSTRGDLLASGRRRRQGSVLGSCHWKADRRSVRQRRPHPLRGVQS